MKLLYLIFILLGTGFAIPAQSQALHTTSIDSFTITAEANGFMCPFLSPMLMQRIEQTGGCAVIKTPALALQVSCPKNAGVTAEKLLALAVQAGYERKLIHVKKVDREE